MGCFDGMRESCCADNNAYCALQGTVHLKGMPRITLTCKALELDYAVAMVGFETRGGMSVPCFDGVVVCEEHADIITDAYHEAERYTSISTCSAPSVLCNLKVAGIESLAWVLQQKWALCSRLSSMSSLMQLLRTWHPQPMLLHMSPDLC